MDPIRMGARWMGGSDFRMGDGRVGWLHLKGGWVDGWMGSRWMCRHLMGELSGGWGVGPTPQGVSAKSATTFLWGCFTEWDQLWDQW